MKGKKLAPFIAVLAFAVPLSVNALGLGPITMRSALNQPLLAEIDVHSVQPGDLDKLAIRLAEPEDFARVNVERGSLLTQFKFSIAFRSDGSPYVKLTTDKPITEPYLDFLIEAKWPRGRALKEYTVLVDPPVLTEEKPAPVQQAVTAPVFTPPQPVPEVESPVRAQTQARVRPVEPNRPKTDLTTPVFKPVPPKSSASSDSEAPSTVVAPARQDISPSGLNYGTVKRNDTLWDIAQQLRSENDLKQQVSVQQMMLALLKSNPSAFHQGNINQLKAGYVLRITDPELLKELSQNSAVQEVRRQTVAWRNAKAGRLVRQSDDAGNLEDSQPTARRGEETSANTTEADNEPESGAQLKLVAPGKEGQGIGSDAGDSSKVSKLKEDLILATETLDANKQETDEIKTRIVDLEEQLSSMQRLINLKDEEMLALQNKLKGQQDTAAAPAKDKPAVTKAKKSGDSGLFSSDTLLFGGAGLLVLAIIGWMIMKRRKMQEGFEESILNVGMASQVGAAAANMAMAAGNNKGRASSQLMGETGPVSDFAMSDMGGVQSDVAEVDPISEADVYLAYGRHHQAEDILKQAISTSPQRLELHSKLLEVYHAEKNAPAFEQHAQVFLKKLGGDESHPLWARVIPLGAELCPGNALFGEQEIGAGDTITNDFGGVTADEEDLLDFDFDAIGSGADALDFTSPDAGGSEDESLELDVSGLDFDLDTDMGQDDRMAKIDAMDNDGGLDFDLALDEPSSRSGKSGMDNTKALDFTERSSPPAAPKATNKLKLDYEDSSSVSASSVSDTEFSLDFDLADDSESDFAAADEYALDEDEGLSFDEDSVTLDDELDDDIFSDVDEIGTKLDLAKAYVDMGDSDGARSILDEVMEEGDASQKQQAEQLLQQMG